MRKQITETKTREVECCDDRPRIVQRPTREIQDGGGASFDGMSIIAFMLAALAILAAIKH